MAKEIYRQKQIGKRVPGKFMPKKQKGPGVMYFRNFYELDGYLRRKEMEKSVKRESNESTGS